MFAVRELMCPAGDGDARPSALTMIANEEMEGQLTNKVMLITGCSSGIGVETARALHATGADIFLTARALKKGADVVQEILASSTGVGKLELLELDLDSLESVRQCASTFLSKSKQLNILITTAGDAKFPSCKHAAHVASSNNFDYNQACTFQS